MSKYKILATSDNNEPNVSDNNENKKIIRRDTERQRRQKMSILSASLRTLLPFELIKGKRSVSDHIDAAANYITYLKEKIHVMETKRDRLKQMVIHSSLLAETEIESSNHSNVVECVKINPFQGGLEIAIDGGDEESCLHLSDFLDILLQEGHDVVSSLSTKVNGRIFHSIKSEVKNLTSHDLARLQQKLNNAILLSRY